MNKVFRYPKQQGMTLLELLVAVALLSIIAVMAFAGIYTLAESKQHMDETVDRFNRENTAIGLFKQDIKMAIAPQLTISANDSTFYGESQGLRLQRFNPYQSVPRQGTVNHLKQQPATVIEIRWFLRDGTLYRATRSAVSTPYAPWQERAMMSLQQIRCQYQSNNGPLLDRWPPRTGRTSVLPDAVHCRMASQFGRQSDMIITPWQQI